MIPWPSLKDTVCWKFFSVNFSGFPVAEVTVACVSVAAGGAGWWRKGIVASASGRGRPRRATEAARPDTRLGESKREKSRSESPSGETAREEGRRRLFLQHLTWSVFIRRYPGVRRRRSTNWTLFSRINYRCWKKIFSKSGGIVEMQGCCNILHWSQFLRSIARTRRRIKLFLKRETLILLHN